MVEVPVEVVRLVLVQIVVSKDVASAGHPGRVAVERASDLLVATSVCPDVVELGDLDDDSALAVDVTFEAVRDASRIFDTFELSTVFYDERVSL